MTDTRQLSTYDGRDRLGMVIQRAGRCDAFDVYGVMLGTFKNVKAASDAVTVKSRFSSCVPDDGGRGGGDG